MYRFLFIYLRELNKILTVRKSTKKISNLHARYEHPFQSRTINCP